MKSKYILTQSNELLSYFNRQNKACFDYSEAFNALPDSKESTLRELLSDMTKRRLLMRLKDGVYYIVPYEANAETFMPDWHLIAEQWLYEIDPELNKYEQNNYLQFDFVE